MPKLLTLKEAREVVTHRYRKISISNLNYLVQYGRLNKFTDNGITLVDASELEQYYSDAIKNRKTSWKRQLGSDLNWDLSFAQYQEAETTKHVHRLHPYKGKFIPQLVAYFLDRQVDQFKTQPFFQHGDIVLDPFCGSGTTLVQASELGIHAIGVEVSQFNALISNVKLGSYDLQRLRQVAREITASLLKLRSCSSHASFDNELSGKLAEFNRQHFPSPQYKRQVIKAEIDELSYARSRLETFLPVYWRLIERWQVNLHQAQKDTFLDHWYLPPVREEIDHVFGHIKGIEDKVIRRVLSLVLCRTMRSCRATTHADLGTLKKPISQPYYCKKHGKICKPLFSISDWWQRYIADTIKRLAEFTSLRTDTEQVCLVGDARQLDILAALQQEHPVLAEHCRKDKIAGIFSSPPYVGLIDYHEQHAYAYELLGLERHDAHEIGSLGKGQGKAAQAAYAQGIAEVLLNCKGLLKPDYHVLLVANDKHDLYPQIAANAGMMIVNRYQRPVLNRVEKDRSSAYSETIFHLREGQ